MARDKSYKTYADCYDVMDRAIANGIGVRVNFGEMNEAWSFRSRLHKARRINREENEQVYEPGHELHGRSIYDRLIMFLEDASVVVKVMQPPTIEDLTDGKSGRNVGDNRAVKGDSEGERRGG